MAPPQEREIYTWLDLFLGFYLFIFSRSRRLKSSRPILTFNGSNGAAWPKEVPFGGQNHYNSNVGVSVPPNPKTFPDIG